MAANKHTEDADPVEDAAYGRVLGTALQADARLAQVCLYALTMARSAERFEAERAGSAPHAARCVQQLSEALAQRQHVLLGLIAMRLLPPEDFVCAVHAAIYAMFMARELGLERADVERVGVAALTQDSRGAPDAPHQLACIIELARRYDLCVQGLLAQHGQSAEAALLASMTRAGDAHDPALVRAFINVLGVYPVGAMVTLSTGERALVVRSPAVGESTSGQAIAHLPTVRLQGSGRLLDLAQPQHASVRITGLLSAEASRAEHPGAFAFF